MMANNETGILFPIKKLSAKAKQYGAYFHSDMVQVLGKEPLLLNQLSVDFASFSAHKVYGVKGCGVLYCKRGNALPVFIQGGPQERKRRAGTENLPGIVAFAQAVKKMDLYLSKNKKIAKLRDEMEKELLGQIKGLQVIGKKVSRLANTSMFYIPQTEGETLLINLDLKGFYVSAGSACNSGKLNSSSVLQAMGLSEEEARSCLRVSLGVDTKKSEIKRFVKTLIQLVKRLRSIS